MRAYREEGFPDHHRAPLAHLWRDADRPGRQQLAKSYTAVDRMRRGKKVIVPGDGSSLWVITHNTDFAKGLVGLLGAPAGHRPRLPHHQRRGHVLGPVLSHDRRGRRRRAATRAYPLRFHRGVRARGARRPASATKPSAWSSTTARSSASFRATAPRCPSREGIRQTMAWFDADPSRRQIDDQANALWDNLIEAYESGLQAALRRFSA